MQAKAGLFQLGDVTLQSGEVLRNAQLAYVTCGALSARGDNAVLFPTYYTGTHRENLAMVGPGRALDPQKYFIVIVNLFGNGESSSPSNHATQGAAKFPQVSLLDNVTAQWRLLEQLGVERLALALGWSMGAQQAYHHAALFPERVQRLLAVCGSARTSPHNWVFLEGVKAALKADPAFAGGNYSSPPLRGLGAFGSVYAGWAYSQAFFRERLYERLGHASPEALVAAWEREHRDYDANDLLCVLGSWQRANIADNPRYGGDIKAALAAIQARAIIMPSSSDLYFPPEDSRLEVAELCHGELRVLESKFGHAAGAPDRIAEDTAFVEATIRELLAA
ncbi:MAG TPA: alpha/beta fold hydrolase [Polyangiaceae bacterium]|nr:alpha/beta fold hydrolase [Polyangiaceae bacterium]